MDYANINKEYIAKCIRLDTNKNYLPVRGINKIGLHENTLIDTFVYGMIAGTWENAISQNQLVELTGCAYSTFNKSIKRLQENGYIEFTGTNIYKVPIYKIVEKKETIYNFNWNLFSDGNKYGILTARAFGLYFYMRSTNNKVKLGNGYCCLTDSMFKRFQMELYLLQQDGLITIVRYKEQIVVCFTKEYKYKTIPGSKQYVEKVESKLTQAGENFLKSKFQSKEAIEKKVNTRRKQCEAFFTSQ